MSRMREILDGLGILTGGGDASSYDEAMEMAAAANKPVLVDLFVPF